MYARLVSPVCRPCLLVACSSVWSVEELHDKPMDGMGGMSTSKLEKARQAVSLTLLGGRLARPSPKRRLEQADARTLQGPGGRTATVRAYRLSPITGPSGTAGEHPLLGFEEGQEMTELQGRQQPWISPHDVEIDERRQMERGVQGRAGQDRGLAGWRARLGQAWARVAREASGRCAEPLSFFFLICGPTGPLPPWLAWPGLACPVLSCPAFCAPGQPGPAASAQRRAPPRPPGRPRSWVQPQAGGRAGGRSGVLACLFARQALQARASEGAAGRVGWLAPPILPKPTPAWPCAQHPAPLPAALSGHSLDACQHLAAVLPTLLAIDHQPPALATPFSFHPTRRHSLEGNPTLDPLHSFRSPGSDATRPITTTPNARYDLCPCTSSPSGYATSSLPLR
ncbi:uncharacterized protein PSFLO_00152 [Pseudozyma flocculosa]|uniref:Uncharacterized protein n=1 Tax=Pseudozyma flocculosa TaxID=84751 RepID=A0A5C3EUI8_9BASI|nr:uncharacterized protein PSFLO_00152 [Pseudozyma flocculosa]